MYLWYQAKVLRHCHVAVAQCLAALLVGATRPSGIWTVPPVSYWTVELRFYNIITTINQLFWNHCPYSDLALNREVPQLML